MAIDFELSEHQRKLQADARAFAEKWLKGVREQMQGLDSAGRFELTRPAYTAAVEAGYLKLQIPKPLGGNYGESIGSGYCR